MGAGGLRGAREGRQAAGRRRARDALLQRAGGVQGVQDRRGCEHREVQRRAAEGRSGAAGQRTTGRVGAGMGMKPYGLGVVVDFQGARG